MAGNEEPGRSRIVTIPPAGLKGALAVPEGDAAGIILFAHGSGSSRFSPRNAAVASELRRTGFATLLFDLLSEAEAADRANVFDIALLAERLVLATQWVQGPSVAKGLAIGYFGASTGAAAALVAAARLGRQISAIVSRGGRPDLAGCALPQVTAPSLLIVGGADREVLALNREAFAQLRCKARLAVVPGATHLFEERGALEEVVELACGWFHQHLPRPSREPSR